jgi:hypothetical protein
MEIELCPDIRLKNFPDNPEYMLVAGNIGLFRERIANNHKGTKILKSICNQFNEKGIAAKTGSIKDATFI